MVEEEHFSSFKKCLNLVFPWKLGPYTVRNRVSLTLVSRSLRGMEFPQDQAINYDPHQVISKIRTALKCRPFEHTEVPGLREKENWHDFPNPVPMGTSTEQDMGSQLPRVVSPQKELDVVLVIIWIYSSLVNYSVSSMKRGSTQPMDTDEVDTTTTPKK